VKGTDPRRFSSRLAMAAATVAAAIGAGACATSSVRINDLTFVGLRRVDPQSPLPQYVVKGGRLIDTDFIEATLASHVDLFASLNGRSSLAAIEWFCRNGSSDDFPQVITRVFENPDRVVPQESRDERSSTAGPGSAISKRHLYTIYFPVRATAEHIDALSPDRTAYDLEKAAGDVCVELVNAGYYQSVSIRANVVTIPSSAFEALFATRPRN